MQVVPQILPGLRSRASGALDAPAIAGVLAGPALMYATSLLTV